MQNLKISISSSEKSSIDTFKGMSQCSSSVYSSPREKVQKEALAYERVLPFDFVTQRKAKMFFGEEIIPIDKLLQDKKLVQTTQAKLSRFEDETEILREVPELNERLKFMLRVLPKRAGPKKAKKLTIKGEFSSSSEEDAQFDLFNYAQKVQNQQTRDNNNELVGMFFQRAYAKSTKERSKIYQSLNMFLMYRADP